MLLTAPLLRSLFGNDALRHCLCAGLAILTSELHKDGSENGHCLVPDMLPTLQLFILCQMA